MKKNKLLILVMICAMLMTTVFAGCSKTSSSSDTATSSTSAESTADASEAEESTESAEEAAPAEEQKSYKIGMDVSSLSNDTFVQFQVVFEAFCEARGWTLISNENNEDPATQVSNLENMITAGCDAIFSQNSDPTSTADIYQRIVDSGIILVSYDSISDIADYSFYCDNYSLGYTVGQSAGEWINENIDGEAHAIVFQAPFAEYMIERSEGDQAGLLETCPNAVIDAVVDLSSENAADVVENSLQAYPEATIFIFPSDVDGFVAYQIIQPILEQKNDDGSRYGIFSNDCTANAVALIAQDTIYRSSVNMGLNFNVPNAALEAIEYALTGEGTEHEKTSAFMLEVINVNNAQEYIDSLG